jgi:hypothetical protein
MARLSVMITSMPARCVSAVVVARSPNGERVLALTKRHAPGRGFGVGESERVERALFFDRVLDVSLRKLWRRIATCNPAIAITPYIVVTEVVFQNSPPAGDELARLAGGLVDGAAHRGVCAEIIEPSRLCARSEPQFALAVLEPDRHNSRYPASVNRANSQEMPRFLEELIQFDCRQPWHEVNIVRLQRGTDTGSCGRLWIEVQERLQPGS